MQKPSAKPTIRKEFKKNKTGRYCDHCKIKGHLTDQCFKIHGYPDWYREKFGSKIKLATQIGLQNAQIDKLATPLEESHVDTTLTNTICQEVLKALQSKQNTSVNMASGHTVDEPAGPYY